MSEWWQQPYPGGPMVAVKGFPRPLYPPDAATKGQTPSIPGADVEGYKRCVSRAGRWPWQSFDQAYSNGFAHGLSGNVPETGVAGVQRQGGISDTGWVGLATFNLLRSIRIPEGLPNAGHPAMDTRAVELINAAYDRFQGSPAPPATTTSALARLAKAQSQIGQTESPPDSNMQPYGAWYGMDGVPWCAIFLTWCDCLSSDPSGVFVRGSQWSYVPDIVTNARLNRAGLWETGSPAPGDLVAYDWNRDGTFDHIGLWESGDTQNWVGVEGNTGDQDFSNGGAVLRTQRSRSMADVVFIKVREP